MKLIRQLMFAIGIVVAAAALLTALRAVHGQGGTAQGTRGRNDPINAS